MKKKIFFGILALVWIFSLMTEAQAGEDAMIADGKKVKMHYTLKVEGQTLDSTRDKEPFEFVYGSEGIIPGLQNELKGLKAGDQKQFTVTSENAFGSVDPEAIVEVPRKNLPEGDIQVGMMLTTAGEGGQPLQAIVKEVRGENVLLDFNHPLAGKELSFDIEILAVS